MIGIRLGAPNNIESEYPNLEYDMEDCDWICEKIRGSDIYAQNFYAALCNNEFQRNEVWPILKDQTWGCTWRYAGVIVAHIRREGDYIDWYCSGIRGGMVDVDSEADNNPGFVSEGLITDEILVDLLRLGWVPCQPRNSD